MKSLINKVKLAGAGLLMSLALTNCELPTEPELPNYDLVKSTIYKYPSQWEYYMGNEMYAQAINLTYPNSFFYNVTKQQENVSPPWSISGRYHFEDMRLSNLFDVQKGIAVVDGKYSPDNIHYYNCNVTLKSLPNSDKTKPSSWKLHSYKVSLP